MGRAEPRAGRGANAPILAPPVFISKEQSFHFCLRHPLFLCSLCGLSYHKSALSVSSSHFLEIDALILGWILALDTTSVWNWASAQRNDDPWSVGNLRVVEIPGMKQPRDAAQMEFATGEPGTPLTIPSLLLPHRKQAGPFCMSLRLSHPELLQLAWLAVTQLGCWLAWISWGPRGFVL